MTVLGMMGMARYDERIAALMQWFVLLMVPYSFTLLLFFPVPQEMRDVVMALVGVIVANASQVAKEVARPPEKKG